MAEQRERVFAVSSVAAVLIQMALSYWGAATWVLLSVPLFWIGLLIHNNMLIVIHDLAEINDQLAGRKDEFWSVLSSKADDNGTL